MIEPKTIVFMGVSGSSKTTIGRAGPSWPQYWGNGIIDGYAAEFMVLM